MSSVTVPAQDPLVVYTVGGTPSAGPFAFSFPYFDEEEIVVWKTVEDSVSLVLPSDYTLAGTAATDDLIAVGEIDADDGFTGGNVTLDVAVSNCKISIYRFSVPKRTTDFPTTGAVNMAALNVELDRQTMILQELFQTIQRSVRARRLDGTMSELPLASARAGKLLGFNGSGNPIAVPIADVVTGLQKIIDTDTYTLLEADAGYTLIFTSDDPVTVTVPDSITTPQQTALVQAGAGVVTVAEAGSAVIVNFLDGPGGDHRSTAGLGACMTLHMWRNTGGTAAEYFLFGITQAL